MALLLYLLVGALAVLGAARLYRPFPYRDGLVLLFLPLVLTGGALARGHAFAPVDLAFAREPLASLRSESSVEVRSDPMLHDVWSQMIPWHAAVRRALAEGELPLWNPYVLGGAPLLGAYQPGALHPVRLLGLALPLPSATTWMATATLLLAALAMYLLAGELGVSSAPALLTAATWCFGAYLTFWLQWAHGLTAASSPLLLAAAIALRRSAVPRRVVAFAVALALLLLGGSPEAALISGTIAAVVLVGASLRAWRSGGPRWLARAALGALIGAAIAAPQWAPFVEALPQTAEWSRRNASAERPEAWPAVSEVARSLLPVDRPSPRDGEPAPRGTAWIGGWPLAMALLGLARSRSAWRLLFGALFLAGSAFALALPPVAAAAGALPLLSLVVPRYGWLAASLAACGLFALGAQVAFERGRERSIRVVLLAAPTLLVASAALAGSRLDSAQGVAMLIGGAIAVLALAFDGSTDRRLALLLVLLVAERAWIDGPRHGSVEPAAFLPEPPVVARLRQAQGEGRVVALGNLLYPNLSAVWGLADVRGYDPMQLRRWVEIQPEWAWARGSGSQYTRVRQLTPMLSFLGVRAALTERDVTAKGWRVDSTDGRLRILRNDRAMPPAFSPAILLPDDGGDGWRALLRDADALRRTAWLEGASLDGSGDRVRNGRCKVESLARGFRPRFRTSCDQPSWIVTSIPAWRGWRARADGGALPMAIANHAFVAFRAPAGERTVELRYLPWTFPAGCATALLGLVGTLAWLRRGTAALDGGR